MLPPLPTLEDIELAFWQLEASIPLPSDIANAVQSVFHELGRYGPPQIPDLSNTFERFVVQIPAPPPPPPPKSFSDKVADWIANHKWAVALTVLFLAGGVSFGAHQYQSNAILRRRMAARNPNAEAPRDIVVILGADAIPYGIAIVRDFEQQGYIVIATVSNSEAIEDMEQGGHGYVRALVLDPEEPESIPQFLRSLQSAMSLRFPTTSSGDPYLSMSGSRHSTNIPRLVSIVSLLSLASTELTPFSAIPSPLALTQSYLSHLTSRTLTPLSVIQSTLPLFRVRRSLGRPSSRETPSFIPSWLGLSQSGASVILCVPAFARVGAVGSSSVTMASEAVTRGLDVLRREVAVENTTESEGCPSFVTVDVGEVAIGRQKAGERSRYPSDVRAFSNVLIGIVKARAKPWTLEWLWNIWLGDRRLVGAGALTYVAASRLPNSILDFMLALPYRLQSIRSSLYPESPISPSFDTASTVLAPRRASITSSAVRARRPSQNVPEVESSRYSSSASPPPIEEIGASRHQDISALSTPAVISLPNSEPVSDFDSYGESDAEPSVERGRGVEDSWVSLRERSSASPSFTGRVHGEQRRLVIPAATMNPEPVPNNGWAGEPHFLVTHNSQAYLASGVMTVPTGGQRSHGPTGESTHIFFCHKGMVKVMIQGEEFVVSAGDTFMVPQLNNFGVRNVSEGEAVLYYAEAPVPTEH